MLKGDSQIDTAAREHQEGPSQAHQRLSSRRTFLSGSAKLLGGGALALGLGAAPAFAKGNDDEDEDKKQGGKRNNNNGSGVSDVDILNYALVLERLEYEFYKRYLDKFSEGQIEGNAIFNGFGKEVRNDIYENLKLIRNHEKTHVETLIAVIIDLGGNPVGGESLGGHTEYKFPVKNVKDFIAVAQTLEDTGVMAYDGAIAYIHRPGLQTAGATIATVEARHASYLRLLNGEVPFPEAFDEPKAPRQVCEMVDPFITKSPFNLKAFCESLPNKVITL
jgi:rubrerythrin